MILTAKKNTAITGFSFLILDSTGSQETAGTVTGYYSHNGTYQDTLTNSPSYDSSLKAWKVNLTAGELNSDLVSITFTHDGTGIDTHFQIHTTVKTIDDLNDVSTSDVNSEVDTALSDINLDHLLAVQCDSTDITNAVVNHSVMANIIGLNGDISEFNNGEDTLQNIYENLEVIIPQIHFCDSNSAIIDGLTSSGSYTDTTSNNQTYWSIDDTGTGISVSFVFDIGENRQPSHLLIDGYFNTTDGTNFGKQATVYAYNYQDSSWSTISTDETTKMKHNTSDRTYVLPLEFSNHKHEGVTPGEVKIKIESSSANSGDSLNIDQIFVSSELETNTPTSVVTEAIWSSRHSNELARIESKVPGEVWYVDPELGDDNNNGHYLFSPLKTIATALSLCGDGDMIKLAAKEFVEAGLEIHSDGVEIRGFPGSVIKTHTGDATGLSIYGVGCTIKDVSFNNIGGGGSAATLGIYVDTGATTVTIEDCVFLAYPLAINTIASGGGFINKTYAVFCLAGFEIGGSAIYVKECFALNPFGTSTVGYDITSDGYSIILESCYSGGCATAGFRVNTGATGNFIIKCVSGVNDGALVDNGTNTTIDDFSVNVTLMSEIDTGVNNIEAKLPPGTISDFDPTTDGVNVTQIEGVSLSNKVGDNLDYFFQNAGEDTTKTVDDVEGFSSSDRTSLSNIPTDVNTELSGNHGSGSWETADTTSMVEGIQTGIIWL